MSAKVLERTSQFFAINFKEFKQDLKTQIQNPPFEVLSFKCCGYGYFLEYKKEMVKKFILYLKDALLYCKALTTLKIVFNGFDLELQQIEQICEPIFQIIRNQPLNLKILWIHTSHLRLCRIKDIQQLFNIIDKFGLLPTSEQISIQMSDWQFQQNKYPSYTQLFKVFQDFDTNIPQNMSLNYRRFRLQISSWYMKDKQAYSFLKDTLDVKTIKSYLQSSRQDQKMINSHNRLTSVSKMKEEDRQSTTKSLDDYLDLMDIVSLFPPLPKQKDNEIQHEKIKKQQTQILQSFKQAQRKINATLMKFPMEYIKQLRVDHFHNQMIIVIVALLYRLSEIQDFQLDMRNWNSAFNLSGLKKQLDTKVNTKKEFSIIRKRFGVMSKNKTKMWREVMKIMKRVQRRRIQCDII